MANVLRKVAVGRYEICIDVNNMLVTIGYAQKSRANGHWYAFDIGNTITDTSAGYGTRKAAIAALEDWHRSTSETEKREIAQRNRKALDKAAAALQPAAKPQPTERDLIEQAAAQFPSRFGLRNFTGKVFSIDEHASYISGGVIQLYVCVLNGGLWQQFAKGTPAELHAQSVHLRDEKGGE
jgi:hypothetical protein